MPSDERIDLRVTADEKARYAEAAKTYGLALSPWLRMLAKRDADKVLGKSRRK